MKDEIAIEAVGAIPRVPDGTDFSCASWYLVTPEKVTVCFFQDEEDKVREFNIKDVKLSGVPAGYFDSSNDSPNPDMP